MASDDTGNRTPSNRMRQRLLRIAATFAGEVFEQEASAVIGHAPLFVVVWPQR